MIERLGLLLLSYFLGAIPTGYWLGRIWKGIDIRSFGSGNLGATNVLRVLGPVPGMFTLACDGLKGVVPVLVAQYLFPGDLLLHAVTGMVAIVGHTTSIFVHFRGGKGVATAAGVFSVLMPFPCACAGFMFVVTVALTRFVSLGSLLGVLTLVISSFIFSTQRPLVWTAAAVAAFVVWTHRGNIQRLREGTENRIQWPKKNT
jgi:glycerol-3-phosphate acyltransferase PlsY